MADPLQYRIVDVFAGKPYTGNPAGVVLDADALTERQMLDIAREINLSDTAFVSRLNDIHRPPMVRWFTPGSEVAFCGHATLAAVHVLAEAGLLPADLADSDKPVEFETSAGMLPIHCEKVDEEEGKTVWWLSMPDADLKPERSNPMKACDALGLTMEDLDSGIPLMRTRDNDVIVMIRSWRQLQEIQPDFKKLAEWSTKIGVRGFCVATTETLDNATHVCSRFFAPDVGIDEDPVTGSVHGPLATLLIVNELVPVKSKRSLLFCVQGQPGGRTGLVRVLAESTGSGYRVAISGQCYTTMAGQIRLLPAEH